MLRIKKPGRGGGTQAAGRSQRPHSRPPPPGTLFTEPSSWRQETFCQKYRAQNIVGTKYLILLAPPTQARAANGCGEKVWVI